MKTFISIFLIVFVISLNGCSETVIKADSEIMLEDDIENQEPIKVSLCDIKNNPAEYNHKLVEVTGFFSHGFENSSVDDPECSSDQFIWFEYGGTANSGTVYCCGVSSERRRREPLTVENISIPLVEDENFRTLDKLLQRPPDAVARATVIGRFFSGKKTKLPEGAIWTGFGHMGMGSLLAIQKVVTVDSQENKDLDYRASDSGQPALEKAKSYRFLSAYDSQKDVIEMQKKAESGERDWSFNDSQRVAVEALAKLSKTTEKSITKINKLRQLQGSVEYKWKNKKEDGEYIIVVSRPYWLSFYAKDPKKVAWTIFAAYRIPCE